MTRIFVTGATGYIGGDALQTIASAHDDYDITCLVRSTEKGSQISKQLPNAKIVIGDLDSSEILERESEIADVICHWADADHERSANSIIKGLSKHPQDRPGYLIHTGGAGILMMDHFDKEIPLGELSEKIFDDWDGIEEVTSLPDTASHRAIDKIVLGAGSQHEHIKTAIVCPPTVYGTGTGPVNRRSYQMPELAKVTLLQGEGVQVGNGRARWGAVHVQDLSRLYLGLVEEAVNGGGKATWGSQGYYFAEQEEFAWGDMSQAVADAAYAKGLIKTDRVRSIDSNEAGRIGLRGVNLWAVNSRCRAIRARKLLDWEPREHSIKQDVPIVLDVEARSLRLKS